jgi:imidazolonepropionase-like amidohydrolase
VDDAGLIVYAGPAATAPPTPTAAVDLYGRTLLPGFFDCHTHLCMTPGRGLVAGLTVDPTVETFEIAGRLRTTLRAGVTTADPVLQRERRLARRTFLEQRDLPVT